MKKTNKKYIVICVAVILIIAIMVIYEITGNKTISEFQGIIHPVMIFVKNKFKDLLEPINIEMKEQGQIVTHADLLDFLKNRDEFGYRRAIEQHFEVYKRFLNSRK